MSLTPGDPTSPKKTEADASEVSAQNPPTPAPIIQELANSDHPRHARTKHIIDALTLCAVIFYGGVAYFQWQAMITANQQTKEALHISERAYITTDSPTLDTQGKYINFFITNSGHIPSGKVEVIVHEATVNSPIANAEPVVATAVEANWKRHRLPSLPPGKDLMGYVIPLPEFAESKFTPGGAHQAVIVAGRVAYYDGFPDDDKQEWQFCFQSVYQLSVKKIYLVACDPLLVIPQMEGRDGYPGNEQRD